MKKYISPSLLNIEEGKRLASARELIANGIEWIHYDIMDGEFVDNLAIEVQEIAEIKERAPHHIMDAHLMVVDPQDYADELVGIVDYVTLHFESMSYESIEKFIKENRNNFKIGLAIKPKTPVKDIVELIPLLDLVLIMSVEPGKGGQSFIPESLNKIKEVKKIIEENQLNTLIQVDGGINDITAPQAFEAGADILVAGTYLVINFSKAKLEALLK